MTEELEILKSLGYEIHKFTDHHYRVNDKIDIWPKNKKFHILEGDERGIYTDLVDFIEMRLDLKKYLHRIYKETPIQVINNHDFIDKCAIEAMKVVIQNTPGRPFNEIAEKSFKVAIAMNEERNKIKL